MIFSSKYKVSKEGTKLSNMFSQHVGGEKKMEPEAQMKKLIVSELCNIKQIFHKYLPQI